MSRAQKISLLIALYFAQGLPFGFFTIALPAMLRQSGQSLKTISLVSVPVGTIFGIYAIVILFNKDTEALFVG